MVYFINVLRALACCIITNSHYTGVYPLDFIANGGLAGNALFCAVSGYCLYNIRSRFPQWYGKRLIRCYLPVWIITAVYMLLGCFTTQEQSALSSFLFPTRYHFVASIILLYIPFFVVMKVKVLREHLPWVLGGLGAVAAVYYVLFFDKSHWHVEDVRGFMERCTLFAAMLMGAWFRQNDGKYRNKLCKWFILLAPLMFGVYLGGNFLFSKKASLAMFQIISPLCRLVLVYCVFRLFMGLDGALQKLPKAVRRCIDFLAAMTLEVYLVQGEIIDWLRPKFGFPVNWLVLTATILLAGLALHWVCEGIMKLFEILFRKPKTP